MVGDGAASGSRQRRRLARGRFEPRHHARLGTKIGGLEVHRVHERPRASGALLRPDRGPAGAALGVGDTRTRDRSASRGLPDRAGTRRPEPRGSRDGAHRFARRTGGRTGGTRTADGRRGTRGTGRRGGRDPREATLAAVAACGPMSATRARRIAPGWWFVAPALVLIVVFFLGPVLAAVGLSLTDFDLYALADPSTARFVGLRNYTRVLHEPLFWLALRNTLYFALLGAPLTVAASLGAALLVNARALRHKAVARAVFFAPFVTTLVAVAIVWRYLYHPRYGLLNWLLGHVGIPQIDWLGDPRWAMPAIILMATWKNF